MKGHLELFENRLKQVARGLKEAEGYEPQALFLAFSEALGETVPFYDVHSGKTLADYYNSEFIAFVKRFVKAN